MAWFGAWFAARLPMATKACGRMANCCECSATSSTIVANTPLCPARFFILEFLKAADHSAESLRE